MEGLGFEEDYISIHAAQEGCDIERAKIVLAGDDFNPRSPRGLRHEGGYGEFT